MHDGCGGGWAGSAVARQERRIGALAREAKRLLRLISDRCPQSYINGRHNIWIVKPSGKSRGRGIKCFNNVNKLEAYITQETNESMWIAQKYIERPLIVHGRKFDLRQWVLVTDWNPLEVWFYGECYVRFCAEDFDLLDMNSFAHLSNNSIAKYSEKFESDGFAEGNMWDQKEFSDFLTAQGHGPRAFEEKIQPGMHRAVVASLMSATDMIKARKGGFEMYGYDFLLDDKLNVWLCEINSSPSMEHSTPVTERLCQRVLDDIFKVVVDLPEERARRQAAAEAEEASKGKDKAQEKEGSGKVPEKDGAGKAADGTGKGPEKVSGGQALEEPPIDTGLWQCIHGPLLGAVEVPKPPNYFGSQLVLSGSKLKIIGQKQAKPRRMKKSSMRKLMAGLSSQSPLDERPEAPPPWGQPSPKKHGSPRKRPPGSVGSAYRAPAPPSKPRARVAALGGVPGPGAEPGLYEDRPMAVALKPEAAAG